MKKRALYIAFLIVILVSLCACSMGNSNEKTINDMFSALYNCPDEDLVKEINDNSSPIGEDLPPQEPVNYKELTHFTRLFASTVSESYYEKFHTCLITPHMGAYDEGGTSKLESVELSESPSTKGQYEFTATVLCTMADGAKQTVISRGTVRCGEDGKIESLIFSKNSESLPWYTIWD